MMPSQALLIPREEMKKSILHPESEIRRLAVEFLSDLQFPDTEIMPLVIRAVEKYGHEHVLTLFYHAQHFAQTPETLEWAVGELEKGAALERSLRGSYRMHLGELVFNAPTELLRPLQERILKALIPNKPLRSKMTLLFDYEKENFDTLWKRLEELCRKHINDSDFGEDAFAHEAVMKSLCRFGEKTAERVREVIPADTIKTESEKGDPDWWMELSAIQLAGNLRMEDAAETILDKFHDEYDYRNDQCCRALAEIGSDKIAELIHRRFKTASETFRQYTAETLGHIRSAQSAGACLDLIDQEPDLSVRTQLASSLLEQFTHEGLEKLYAIVRTGKWDREFCDLKEDFAWACVLTGKKYPESEAWEKYARKQCAERERKMREAFPKLEQLFGKGSSPDPGQEEKPLLPEDPRALEKTMFDLTRHVRAENPKTIKGIKAVVRNLMGKVIPALAPRDSLEAAQELAYKAFGVNDKAEKIRLAGEALKLSENCADAYVILGEETEDLEEGIRWWRKGVEAGERLFGEKFFKENKGHFWGMFETRPYIRARFNLADALWYDNQKQESLKHLRGLLELNPNDNLGARYLLASRLLELGQRGELLDLVEKRYPEDGTAEWLYTKALLYYEIHGDSGLARDCLEKALLANKHVPSYLLGFKGISERELHAVRFGGEDEARHYCLENGLLWRRNRKAVQWLERRAFSSEPQRREGEKIGRNDPCPCASGKKYKKCCGGLNPQTGDLGSGATGIPGR